MEWEQRPAQLLREPEKSPDGSLIYYGSSIADLRHPERNEDSFSISALRNLVVVCDGVGGLPHPKEASNIATSFLVYRLGITPSHDLNTLRSLIGQTLVDASHEVASKQPGSGTTATFVKIVEQDGKKTALIGHVGDSYGYLFRYGKLIKITEDDDGLQVASLSAKAKVELSKKFDSLTSEEEFERLNDVEKSLWKQRSMITQYLGTVVVPHIYEVVLQQGDKLLLGTDGLDNLTAEEIAHVLRSLHDDPAMELCNKAYERSKTGTKRSRHDDITAVVIELHPAQIRDEQPRVEQAHVSISAERLLQLQALRWHKDALMVAEALKEHKRSAVMEARDPEEQRKIVQAIYTRVQSGERVDVIIDDLMENIKAIEKELGIL